MTTGQQIDLLKHVLAHILNPDVKIKSLCALFFNQFKAEMAENERGHYTRTAFKEVMNENFPDFYTYLPANAIIDWYWWPVKELEPRVKVIKGMLLTRGYHYE